MIMEIYFLALLGLNIYNILAFIHCLATKEAHYVVNETLQVILDLI